MAKFDSSKAYAEQQEVFFDDGREIELLHFVYSKPDIDSLRGSPEAVLAAIDEYGRVKNYLMNVGEAKGKIVTDLIAEVKPQTMVELGGYVGYSCILFGDAVRKAGGRRYYSLERNPEFAAVAMSLVDLAGLSDVVKIIVGASDKSLRRLHANGTFQQIDVLFLDHYKPAYVADLKLSEQLGLIKPGSVLAADNVIKPGNPPYLEYVRASVNEKQKLAEGDPSGEADIPGSAKDRYTGQERKEQDDHPVRGNPILKYESKLVESFEPTGVPDGVEITRCVGESD